MSSSSCIICVARSVDRAHGLIHVLLEVHHTDTCRETATIRRDFELGYLRVNVECEQNSARCRRATISGILRRSSGVCSWNKSNICLQTTTENGTCLYVVNNDRSTLMLRVCYAHLSHGDEAPVGRDRKRRDGSRVLRTHQDALLALVDVVRDEA